MGRPAPRTERSVPPPGPDRAAVGAARGLGYIGLLAAGVAGLTTVQPLPPGFDVGGARLVCLVTAGLSLLMFLPLWGRLPYRASLVMFVVGLTMIAVFNYFAAADAWRYGTFFLVLFVWVGLFHRTWTALALSPLAAVAYVLPTLLSPVPGVREGVWSVTSAVPLCVILGEVIARRSAALLDAQGRLDRLAHVDALTELPNRRAFLAAVDAVAARCPEEADRGHGVAIAFVDLDRFKSVNDTLGHAAGDHLLRETARVLVESVRPGDVVARLAGDEFGVLLHEVSPEGVELVRARLRRAVQHVANVEAPGLGVGASIGVAWLSADGVADALARADEEMYREKRASRAAETLATDRVEPQIERVIPPSTASAAPVT